MSYLILARLRGVQCPWFCTCLHTFPKATAERIVKALDKPDWEYSYTEPESKILHEPPAEIN